MKRYVPSLDVQEKPKAMSRADATRASRQKLRSTPEGEAKYRARVKEANAKRRSTEVGRAKANLACKLSTAKARHTPVGAHSHRMASMASVYKLSETEFMALMDYQKGLCAICGQDFGNYRQRADVDHSHTTNKVRGLLCTRCNTKVGQYEFLQDHKDSLNMYLLKPSSGIQYFKKSTALEYRVEHKNQLCEICKTTNNLVVDHCHKTQEIRGILCTKCNLALASVEGPLNKSIIRYLRSYEI